MILTLNGVVPAKKNRWHRGNNGQIFFDRKGVQKQIDSLVWQIKAQYKGKPLFAPVLDIDFYCKNQRGDIDNMLSTLLDCMKDAGVIISDNLKHLSGPIRINGWLDKKNPRVEINIEVKWGEYGR